MSTRSFDPPVTATHSGPLSGVRVIEFAGLGPAPMCGMVLADLGAQVLRIDRYDGPSAGQAILEGQRDILQRGRLPLAINLKRPEGCDAALQLVDRADLLIEGFRPGVMERLGLGPEVCLARRPELVYGRVTGWGQSGPLAQTAGHDINYLAISGALHTIGRKDSGPVPPLNLVADYAGGAMFLAVGLLAALLNARATGRGQVVDAAMTDGVAVLQALTLTMQAMGLWKDERQSNLLDGGAPRYDTYACADGRHVAVGALEPQFYSILLQGLGLADDERMQKPDDPGRWPVQRELIRGVLRTQVRDHWVRMFEGSDGCLSPVLSLAEAPLHPHNQARSTFVEVDGLLQPGTAPRFSKSTVPGPARMPDAGADGRSSLARWGWTPDEIERLMSTGTAR